MGSPLSPALCLMVVSISEQIWSINFNQLNSFPTIISSSNTSAMWTTDSFLATLASNNFHRMKSFFHGKPIILETEPDQEFLGFMLETS
jgi:hypothetical protein